MAQRRHLPHAHHAAARARLGERARIRRGPRVVRPTYAGLQRQGATGERGLLHFGEGRTLGDFNSPYTPRH